MPLCTYGSSPKPGAPPYVWLTWLDAQSWLGTVFSKLSPFAYLIQPVLAEINAFCGADPPQPVYPGDATVAAAATNPIAFEAVVQYIKDSVYWSVWSNQCQCDAPSTPTWNDKYQSCTTNQGLFSGLSAPTFTYTIQPGDSQFRCYYYVRLNGSYQGYVWLRPRNAGGYLSPDIWGGGLGTTFLWNESRPVPSNVPLAGPFAVPAGATQIEVWQTNYSTAMPGNACNAAALFQVFNGGAYAPAVPTVPTTSIPSFPLQSSCTTDQLCTLIQQVLQGQQLTRTMVDLVQRQGAPFGYIKGAGHAVSGAGSLAVADILGLATAMTFPAWAGSYPDNPSSFFGVGTITFHTPDGAERSIALRHVDDVFLGISGAVTQISWSLPVGVSGTIYPLSREP